jgi:hypothetical protein
MSYGPRGTAVVERERAELVDAALLRVRANCFDAELPERVLWSELTLREALLKVEGGWA